jgi:hypothetical protein
MPIINKMADIKIIDRRMYTTKILNISILQEGRKRLELTKCKWNI